MKLYELLQVFNQEEFSYQDAINYKPLPYIAIHTQFGGTIRLNDTEVFASRLATYNEKFLNATVKWASIENGHLQIFVSEYQTNEDWKEADKKQKDGDLPSLIGGKVREFIRSKTEPKDDDVEDNDDYDE